MDEYSVTKTPSSSLPVEPYARRTHHAVSPRTSIRAVPTTSPICHGGRPRYSSTSKSAGARKSRSRRVANLMSPRMRETRKVRMSFRSRSSPTTYQRPLSLMSAYGLSVRSLSLSRRDRPVLEPHRPLLRDRVLELRQPARRLGRVVGIEHLDAARRLGRRLAEAGPSEREVLEREPQRLGVRELPLEQVEGGLQRRELLVLELELREEVLLRAERVQLLAGELVALRLQRDAEREELSAVGVEAPREGLVRHLGVALDVRLDVACGDRSPLGHEEGDERELPDQLVRVVRHPRQHPTLRACGSQLWKACGWRLRRGFGLEVLVRRAVVALRERRALARLALARRRPAAGDPPSSRPDSICSSMKSTAAFTPFHCPRDLRLRGDREVAADVLEQRPVGLREVERIARQPLHRLLARLEHGAARFELGLAVGVRIDMSLIDR